MAGLALARVHGVARACQSYQSGGPRLFVESGDVEPGSHGMVVLRQLGATIGVHELAVLGGADTVRVPDAVRGPAPGYRDGDGPAECAEARDSSMVARGGGRIPARVLESKRAAQLLSDSAHRSPGDRDGRSAGAMDGARPDATDRGRGGRRGVYPVCMQLCPDCLFHTGPDRASGGEGDSGANDAG